MDEERISLNLLDLPNCVLLTLLSYLDTTSLYNLSQVSDRVGHLIDSDRFWKHIDARQPPNNEEKYKYCTSKINKCTHTVLYRGADMATGLASSSFYKKLVKFKCLRVLALEHQYIDVSSIKHFPDTLQELSLRKTCVVNPPKFFRLSSDHMKNLRVLILDECDWVRSSCFVSLAKYPKLEILSFYNCEFIEDWVSYLSLAFMNGFKQLKVLDARLAPLGNTLLHCVARSSTLMAVYLQNKDASYQLDLYQRQLSLYEEAKAKGCKSCNENLEAVAEAAKRPPWCCSDDGLMDFLAANGINDTSMMPKSCLYVDPYNSCACLNRHFADGGCGDDHSSRPGSFPRQNDNNGGSGSSSSDDDDDDDHGGDQGALLRQKIKRLKRLRNADDNHRETTFVSLRRGRTYRNMLEQITVHNPDRIIVVDVPQLSRNNPVQVQVTINYNNRMDHGREYNNETVRASMANLNRPSSGSSDSSDSEHEENVNLDKKTDPSLPVVDPSQPGPSRLQKEIQTDMGGFVHGSRFTANKHIQTDDNDSSLSDSSSSSTDEPPSKMRRLQEPEVDDEDSFSSISVEEIPLRDGRASLDRYLDNNELVSLGPASVRQESRQLFNLRRPPTPHREQEQAREQQGDEPIVEFFIRAPEKRYKLNLQRLSLRGHKGITDYSLRYIKDLNLKLLDLTYTNVTKQGISEFLTYVPSCRIVHESCCVCPPNLHF